MLDWHSCQICYPLEIKILLLLSNTRTTSRARFNMKRPVVKTTKPHKVRIPQNHRLRAVGSINYQGAGGRVKAPLLSTILHPVSPCNSYFITI